jgi:CDGSH-type Zn-finger protein
VNTVRVRENGPLAMHGDLAIAGQEKALRATLCRCGQSQKKPYCDGSHTAAGFQATGEPAIKSSEALTRRDGALKVLGLPNGPLQVQGALEIVSGTGHTVNRVMQTYLCRCGGSANKPYCDGTHGRIGFKAP